MARLSVRGVCGFLSLLACGCGGSADDGRVAVSGIVRLDGAEVSGGRVLFTPQKGTAGPVASAPIDDTGMYRLSSDQGPGTGAYNVKISLGSLAPENKFERPTSQTQAFNEQTVITTEGAGGLNFDLVTPQKSGRRSR